MNLEFQDSVIRITSSDTENSRFRTSFGTGFIIRQVRNTTYLLTCAHVVRDVGGPEKVKVGGNNATVIAYGEEIGLDLAVVKVDGLPLKPALSLRSSGEKGRLFRTVGYQTFDKDMFKVKELGGILGELVGLEYRNSGDRIKAWELQIHEEYSLQPGYSGSPVIDEATSKVLGVVSHRQGEKVGLAISVEELEKIWRILDSEELYQTLLDLGYQKQEELFWQLTIYHALAVFLIHGAPAYGQCWLLKRLLVRRIHQITKAKIYKADLGRKARRNDTSALWRELKKEFGVEEPLPSQVAEGVYQSWQTQHVILIFSEVEQVPESVVDEIIQEFWLPLVDKVQASTQQRKFKLLMFLIDYEGIERTGEVSFANGLDDNWKPSTPIRSPKLTEFSDFDLRLWIEKQFDKLPLELVNDVDGVVKAILQESNEGIPEDALEKICDRCYVSWEEESGKWLKL